MNIGRLLIGALSVSFSGTTFKFANENYESLVTDFGPLGVLMPMLLGACLMIFGVITFFRSFGS